MATSTNGGSTASFSNAPQATGDVFLSSTTGLTEDVLKAVTLDVMANDLGGNAKTLWSLDNASSVSVSGGTAPADLLAQDTARAAAASSDTSQFGARIWITSDGKVGYDASTLNETFKTQLQGLQAGQYLTDTFTYAIRLGNGTLSWTTAQVQFGGANDGPTMTGDYYGAVTEQATAAGDLTDTGVLTFSDADLTDSHTASVSSAPGNLGVLTIVKDHDTTGTGTAGQLTWTYTVADSAVEHLAAGESKTETFTVTVDDGHGGVAQKTVTVEIHGTNDAPVITSAPQSGEVSEGDDQPAAATHAGGQVTFSDVDATDTHSFDISTAAAHGATSVDADGAWRYTVADDGAVDALAAGETLTDSFTVRVADNHGGYADQIVNITIIGTNDAPVVAGALTASAAEGDAAFSANLLAGASDVDHGETETLSVTGVSYVVDGGASSTSAPAGVSLTGATLSVDPTDPAFDHLAAGEHTTIVVSYNVADAHGATVAQTETITIIGTNDAPVVAGALTASAAEGDAAFSANLLAGASDVDHGETETLSVTGVSYVVDGGASSTTAPAGVSLAGATLSVDPTDPAFDHLAAGEHTTIVVSYNVADAHGATVAQTETITIIGTNDAPVVAGALTASAAEGGAAFSTDLLAGASDVDHGETETLSVTGVSYVVDGGASSTTAPAGVSLAGATLSVDPTDPAFDHLAAGEHTTIVVSYNVADAHGAVVAQTETITITGTNDLAVITGAGSDTVTEAGGVGNATTNDPTGGGKLNVFDVDSPQAFIAQTNAAGDNHHGTFSIGGDGTWSYSLDNTDPAVQALNVGGSLTDSLTVSTADGTTTALTVTIKGANDAAVITGTSVGSVTEAGGAGGGTPTASGTLAAADVDNVSGFQPVSTATASAHGYGAFTIDAAGHWSFTLDNSNATVNGLASGQTLTETFAVSSVDGTSQTVTITINGADDGQLITGGSGSVTLTGGAGDDTILGGSGNETILGNAGNDSLSGGSGTDSLSGGGGNDTLDGGGAGDTLSGGEGNDSLAGGAGNANDSLSGDAGNDTLFGDNGADTLSGGAGDDNLLGGSGDDSLSGGDGADVFIYTSMNDAPDRIADFQDATDKIDLSAIQTGSGDIRYIGQSPSVVANSLTWNFNGANTVIQVDLNGNTNSAEMTITLTGQHTLTPGNFIF